jgi:hypothetical protein
MIKTIKKFTIIKNNNENNEIIGILEELIEYFNYTLECGKSWEHEKNNHKINKNPKTIKSLINNINWSVNNNVANGYSSTTYNLKIK